MKDNHPAVEEMKLLVEERNTLAHEMFHLKEEIVELRTDRQSLERRLTSLQHELEIRNQMKEAVNLCKLLLAGSLVPVASILVLFALLDGSLFVSNS